MIKDRIVLLEQEIEHFKNSCSKLYLDCVIDAAKGINGDMKPYLKAKDHLDFLVEEHYNAVEWMNSPNNKMKEE